MKKGTCLLLVLCFLCGLVGPARAAPQAPTLSVPSAILVEKTTGTVLFEKNADEKRLPASVTKIMTLLLVMEAIQSGAITVDDKVTISRNAQGLGGSQVYLGEGEVYTVGELILATAVASGNDASVALAEYLCGSEETFVARMNERAAELGMTNTVFLDCTGLNDKGDHVTTARDISLMSRELLKHEDIKKYTTVWQGSLRDGTFGLDNTNRLIRFYPGATGLKTGSTKKAKYSMSGTAERDNMELIAVVMSADTSDIRLDAVRTLLDFGFANYALAAVFPEEVLLPVPVILGKTAEVQPILQDDAHVLVEKGKMATLEKKVELAADLEAPVEAGQKLGELTILSDGQTVAVMPIVASEAVERLGTFDIFKKMADTLFLGP